MMVDFIYSVAKLIMRILTWILPVEFINRLFGLMPGRLVIDVLRWYGAEIGDNVKIMPPILFHNFQDRSRNPFKNLHIGSDSFIGRDCFIDLIGEIILEENVTMAMGVTLVTHMNVGNSTVKESFPDFVEKIVIRQGTYIGARTTILAPVEIGSGSLIGACSLVNNTKVASRSVNAGVPAKIIRYLEEK